MGVCFAPCFPVMGAVCANWGCLDEQLLFIATAFGFIQVDIGNRIAHAQYEMKKTLSCVRTWEFLVFA